MKTISALLLLLSLSGAAFAENSPSVCVLTLDPNGTRVSLKTVPGGIILDLDATPQNKAFLTEVADQLKGAGACAVVVDAIN